MVRLTKSPNWWENKVIWTEKLMKDRSCWILPFFRKSPNMRAETLFLWVTVALMVLDGAEEVVHPADRLHLLIRFRGPNLIMSFLISGTVCLMHFHPNVISLCSPEHESNFQKIRDIRTYKEASRITVTCSCYRRVKMTSACTDRQVSFDFSKLFFNGKQSCRTRRCRNVCWDIVSLLHKQFGSFMVFSLL